MARQPGSPSVQQSQAQARAAARARRAAREAARAKTELENLKHAHKKELIELRGEAGTPGVQGGSSSVGSSGVSYDVDRFLNNVYGRRGPTKYF